MKLSKTSKLAPLSIFNHLTIDFCREEGLVIKDPDSKYVLNSRLPTWIKFKPEYIDAMAENCDLIVVGKSFYMFMYVQATNRIF